MNTLGRLSAAERKRAELMQQVEFRAWMRAMAEFNAADRGHDIPADGSPWFARRLVPLGADVLERGLDPTSPQAEVVRQLLGDEDVAAVVECLESLGAGPGVALLGADGGGERRSAGAYPSGRVRTGA